MTREDARIVAEELADVLAERGLVVAAAPPPARVLDVAEVAELLGRSRDWVYDHAADLGAFRLGTGRTARLGFDHQHLTALMRERAIAPTTDTRKPRARRGHAAGQTTDLIPFEETP